MSQTGEFELIELLKQIANEAAANPDLILGIGDDAAAWRYGESVQLVTADMLVEGIHFNLDAISWHDLGWKALAVNISDIAAMGGTPTYALISLGLPSNTKVEQVIEMYRGMAEIAHKFGMSIIGGDTTESPVLTIGPAVIGKTTNDRLMTRSGAIPDDLIAVTGNLGASAAGLKMLEKILQFDLETDSILRESHLRPSPRIEEGKVLSRHGVKVAIDISDGLIADIAHICRASQVSAKIFAENIPIHQAVKERFAKDALNLALSGGEDYELLFTAREEIIEKIKQASSFPITIIGEITNEKSGSVIILDENRKQITLSKTGWEHFGHER